MTMHAYRQDDPAANPLCGVDDATQALQWPRGSAVLPQAVTCRNCRWVAGGGVGPAPQTYVTHGTGYDADLAVRFTYHPPEPEQAEVYQAVRDLAHLFALLIEATTASSREQSLALTHVEEAVMWANASIARRGLSAHALAGAPDLIEHAIQMLLGAKPEGRLAAALSDTNPPDLAADPWPPDGHVHPVLEPLPAGRVTETLRSGLRILAGGHHRPPSNMGDCPGCIAQRVLNGEPVDQTTTEADADEQALASPTGPSEWAAVCPFCPEYIRTEGRGAQRDAQEWVLDHAQQAHGKALRDG